MDYPGDIDIAREPKLAAFLKRLRLAGIASRLMPGVGYRVRREAGGTFLDILFPSAPAPPVAPFQVVQTDALKVKVKGGRVTLHGVPVDVADSDPITVPSNSTAFRVWVSLGDEFGTDSTAIAPAIHSGASGWSGFPAQPVAWAQRHWLLAEVVSSSAAITAINLKWRGGDLPWPPTLGFWG